MSDDDIKREMVQVAIYFDGLIKAVHAIKAARGLKNQGEHETQCLREATDYYYSDMVNCLDLALEGICINVGMDYRAAKNGDLTETAEA